MTGRPWPEARADAARIRGVIGEHTQQVHTAHLLALQYGGVGPSGLHQYQIDMDRAFTLDLAAAGGLTAVRDCYRDHPYAGLETRKLVAAMDNCLLAVTDGKPVPTAALSDLPPYRALMLARVAEKAGIPLQDGTVDQMKAAARTVTGGAGPGWWQAALTAEAVTD